MAAFLWSQKGQPRTHWASWRNICKPITKGGLGLRSVEDAEFGLHGKLAWKILSQESVWARILLQKYGAHSIYEGDSGRTVTSKLWRLLLPHFHNLIQMSHWQIGGISFWCANWCGEVLNPTLGPTLTVREGLQNIEQLEYLLTYEQISRIQLVELDPSEEDKLIFSYPSSGKFTVSKYIDAN